MEPISPIASDDAAIETLGMRWAEDHNAHNPNRTRQAVLYDMTDDSRKRGHGSRGSMDAFASIALATSSIGSPQSDSFTVKLPFGIIEDDGRGGERSPKRARSEKLPSPEWHRTGTKLGSRPATSYEQSADSRTLEAELLLNFSQEARFSTPRPSRRKSTSVEPQTAPLLNGTHGFIFGPTVNDQGPHDGTQYTKTTVHKTVETLLDQAGFSNGKDAEAALSPPKITPHEASSPQHSDSRQTKNICSCGPSHTFGSKPTQFVGSTDNSKASDRGVEPDQEAIYKAQMQIKAIQPGHIVDRPEITSDAAKPELDVLVDLNTHSTDISPLTDKDRMQSTEEDEMEVIEGKLGQQILGFMSSQKIITETNTTVAGKVAAVNPEVSASTNSATTSDSNREIPEAKHCQSTVPAVCAACNFTRNSLSVENDNSSTSWISCDSCKAWFHFACAGFKSEREVRGVDKYRCRECKPIHGPTTYVRKSSRAHTAIDYAGLHQGVFKTSDETPEHHYIKPIKDGTITFHPENFARMRPELVTAEYFEKGYGMKEPIVIPAHFNPRPGESTSPPKSSAKNYEDDVLSADPSGKVSVHDNWFSHEPESRRVVDHGQDALDMVVPRDLTVRRVAELYGPEEKLEVIDVKSQNGEGKKWNMRRWADYYESSGNKVVRNVISLEVSQSKLGKLIRRPQIVRDLDLQDSVWPSELQSKGEYPRVQFYCLMSVADCFTDFHIDFGGSSVFYHILKGKKTFLFIPPKEKHLKKYEEWCMSPAQNWTFLADQTKECYRVDLAEGDTMLIPAGWIHAVWTPEDSLVIGGNFLTRLNYGMQLRIAQIEKSTGVARKFRYPHFQKIQWYTALRYLEDDPLPDSVKDILQDGGIFHRERPARYDFDAWGGNSRSGRENYHARYYSQAELEGLTDLSRYLLRTALIDLGSITEGITTETRNAVKKAIPRGYGEPLDIVKRFAMWSAWKRGEPIPRWASPDAIPEGIAPETAAKLSTAATKRAALETALKGPRRQSARRASQQHSLRVENAARLTGHANTLEGNAQEGDAKRLDLSTRTTPISEPKAPSKEATSYSNANDQLEIMDSSASKKYKLTPGQGTIPRRKPACESCRKRRRACKHRGQVDFSVPSSQIRKVEDGQVAGVLRSQRTTWPEPSPINNRTDPKNLVDELRSFADGEQRTSHSNVHPSLFSSGGALCAPMTDSLVAELISFDIPPKPNDMAPRLVDGATMNPSQSRGRSKACSDCRRSKVRIVQNKFKISLLTSGSDDAYMTNMATLTLRRLMKRLSRDLRLHSNAVNSTMNF